jgi:hypothetical protein
MEYAERRTAKRCPLHHQVMLNRNERERCLASILDTGHKGLRVRVNSPADIAVGHQVEVTSISGDKNDRNGARLSCRVVWESSDREELGLEYLTTEN